MEQKIKNKIKIKLYSELLHPCCITKRYPCIVINRLHACLFRHPYFHSKESILDKGSILDHSQVQAFSKDDMVWLLGCHNQLSQNTLGFLGPGANLIPKIFSAFKMAGRAGRETTRLPRYSNNHEVLYDEMAFLEVISSDWQGLHVCFVFWQSETVIQTKGRYYLSSRIVLLDKL